MGNGWPESVATVESSGPSAHISTLRDCTDRMSDDRRPAVGSALRDRQRGGGQIEPSGRAVEAGVAKVKMPPSEATSQ